jgi:hypothetical protein
MVNATQYFIKHNGSNTVVQVGYINNIPANGTSTIAVPSHHTFTMMQQPGSPYAGWSYSPQYTGCG